MTLLDPHGRRINYLRLSVTGRCNLRCSYCRPQGSDPVPSTGEILSDDDLFSLARTAVGVREREDLGGPARYYRVGGAAGTIGVITPITCHFCGDCNRIRVTSEGFARGCLFSAREVDLKPDLAGRDVEGPTNTLRSVVGGKPSGHRYLREGCRGEPVDISKIGG